MTPASPIVLDSAGEDQTLALGRRLAEHLSPGDIVAMRGELGAGKTRLARGIAEGLGADPGLVSSPTFVLVNIYPAARRAVRRIAHIDAYRLSGEEDMALLGWDRLVGADSVVLIEWAERLGAALPDDRWDIRIDHLGPERRRLTITPPRRRDAATLEAALAAQPPRFKCPICSALVESSSERAPFCSERCKLVDLGKWFGGSYKVSRPLQERDLDEGPP